MDRKQVNDLKTSLTKRLNFIINVYESIEEQDQYDAFISMCDTHLVYCQFWSDKLKPKWYEFMRFNKRKLWKDFLFTAQYTIDELQYRLNAYNAAVKEAMEEQEYYEATRKKLETEFAISTQLNDAQYDCIREQEHKNKIGFITSYSLCKPRKRKSNKKKIAND